MQLPDELNSKRQDPEDEYKTKMYQSKVISTSIMNSSPAQQLIHSLLFLEAESWLPETERKLFGAEDEHQEFKDLPCGTSQRNNKKTIRMMKE